MQAIVLCGGLSTRLKPVTRDKIPKILVEINDRPFIDYLIDNLLYRGCNQITFAVGVHGQQVIDYVNSIKDIRKRFLFNTRFSSEASTLGTGGALIQAIKNGLKTPTHDELHYVDNWVLVVNGDSVLYPSGWDCINVEEQLNVSQSPITQAHPEGIIYTAFTDYPDAMGSLEIDRKSSRILKFNEKRADLYSGGWVSLGWYIIKKDLILNEYARPCSLEYDLLPNWIDARVFESVECDMDHFHEIGTPEGIKRYEKYLRT